MTPLAAMGAPRSTAPRVPRWHNSADQRFDNYSEAVA
jgi:hypothetical protein